ncbi:MAG: rod shape-determining protein MreD [Clostridia bacterium]|nr:rod shape-determining protein MreD [Clostridia bacterium]
MKHFIRAVLVLVFLILQSTFCQFIKIWDIMPNLVLAYIISLALTSDDIMYAGGFGFAAGLLWDITWGRVFGVRTLLFMYIAILAYRAGEYVYRKNISVCVIFTLVGAVITESIFFAANFILTHNASFWQSFFRTIVPSAAYTAAFQLVIYNLCLKISKMGKERSSSV